MYAKLIRLLGQRFLVRFLAEQNNTIAGVFLAFSCLAASYGLANENGALNKNNVDDADQVINNLGPGADNELDLSQFTELDLDQLKNIASITTWSNIIN